MAHIQPYPLEADATLAEATRQVAHILEVEARPRAWRSLVLPPQPFVRRRARLLGVASGSISRIAAGQRVSVINQSVNPTNGWQGRVIGPDGPYQLVLFPDGRPAQLKGTSLVVHTPDEQKQN